MDIFLWHPFVKYYSESGPQWKRADLPFTLMASEVKNSAQHSISGRAVFPLDDSQPP